MCLDIEWYKFKIWHSFWCPVCFFFSISCFWSSFELHWATHPRRREEQQQEPVPGITASLKFFRPRLGHQWSPGLKALYTYMIHMIIYVYIWCLVFINNVFNIFYNTYIYIWLLLLLLLLLVVVLFIIINIYIYIYSHIYTYRYTYTYMWYKSWELIWSDCYEDLHVFFSISWAAFAGIPWRPEKWRRMMGPRAKATWRWVVFPRFLWSYPIFL